MKQFSIQIKHDKRRPIRNSKNVYPVRLRVYSTLTKKTKMYPTDINLSVKDYEDVFDKNLNLKGKKNEYRLFLNELENRAIEAASTLTTFTFPAFEKKLFRAKNASISVIHHYKQKIDLLRKNGQVATASNYELSLKSLGMFILDKTKFDSLEAKNKELMAALKDLTFYDITVNWLNSYEIFMVRREEKSLTTVSMYLRALRTVFNDAISENDIKKDIYPFGRAKNQYQIPTTQKKKKALTSEQITKLFHAEAEDEDQQRAKDFWFLSYALYGMNFKDILLLKFENLKQDTIVYFREKTKSTSRGNLKEINVHLNDFSKGVIEKYKRTGRTNKNDYIFPIIEKGDDVFEQKRKVKNFISNINLFFNKFAEAHGFDFKISTYWARHTFATLSIQRGASMEFISEALSHSNLSVTKNYFAGFEDDTKKEFAKNLMNF
ncbi:tyrosine-type recombinase/integrase [Mangrovimonas aestuarii]|uniref:tyrosine-type recombinase/integrase n=1 Tax=Mangrovimonas aestuarii TaxID=3018443 RepID=UPI002377F867|nr:site-specific integrase [Mangrovimonas aestuarii]